MLILYLVRYRLSNWRSRAQGKLAHSKQNRLPAARISSQFLMWHTRQCFAASAPAALQPMH